MKESIAISTPDHGTLEFELAGFGSRFGAQVVDGILMILCVGLLSLLMVVLFPRGFSPGDAGIDPKAWVSSWGVALLVFLIFLVVWGYFVLFECLMKGTTPGKRQFGIRVIREDGLPIGFRESALRNLVRAADAFPPPTYILGVTVMHMDEYGRRLGDMVAGTLVVRERFEEVAESRSGAAWAAKVERGHSKRPLTLPGGTVTVHQLELVEQFMRRRHQLAADRRAALAWQIASPLLPLMQEDREEWMKRTDCADQCERFLLELLESAHANPATQPLNTGPSHSPEKLF